jgi:hypothetical protein
MTVPEDFFTDDVYVAREHIERIAELTSQRDGLLSVCRELLKLMEATNTSTLSDLQAGVCIQYQDVRTAVEKAEGKGAKDGRG